MLDIAIFALTVTIAALLTIAAIANIPSLIISIREHRASSTLSKWHTQTQIIDSANKTTNTVIILHGFGGSPNDVKELATAIADDQTKVIAAATPFQNATFFAFTRGAYSASHYIAWTTNLIKKEEAHIDHKITLIGLSMGGTLASICAAETNIKRLILIAPYYEHATLTSRAISAMNIARWVYPVSGKTLKANISDPALYEKYTPATMRVSHHAFIQLTKLACIAKLKLRDIKCPTMVILSTNDQVASSAVTTSLISQELPHATVREMNNGNHVLTCDADKDGIAQEINVFIKRSD